MKRIWYEDEQSLIKISRKPEDQELLKNNTKEEWIDYSNKNLEIFSLESTEDIWILVNIIYWNMIWYIDTDYSEEVQY